MGRIASSNWLNLSFNGNATRAPLCPRCKQTKPLRSANKKYITSRFPAGLAEQGNAQRPWVVHLLLCTMLLLGLSARAAGPFVISEFMAVNNTILNDEDGQNSDWIQIHNEGATNANLKGWFLTDSTNNLAQWQFPDTNVPPNGYLVVFASGKDRRTPGNPLHTNFKLSSGGEYLALLAPDGTIS